jgi:hypothetical protein
MPRSGTTEQADAPPGDDDRDEQTDERDDQDQGLEERDDDERATEAPEADAGVWLEGRPATLEAALAQVIAYCGAESTAVVFSGRVEREANVELEQLALELGAARFVIGGGEGSEVEGIAGARAGHESELALALAATAMRTVILIDTKVEFNPLVLQIMGSIQAICLADEHDALAKACTVVLPGSDRAGVLSQIRARLMAPGRPA